MTGWCDIYIAGRSACLRMSVYSHSSREHALLWIGPGLHLVVHRTGAPPPEEATTLHCSPAGCTWLTMASSVLQSPDGPSQLPALTLCRDLAIRTAHGRIDTIFEDST